MYVSGKSSNSQPNKDMSRKNKGNTAGKEQRIEREGTLDDFLQRKIDEDKKANLNLLSRFKQEEDGAIDEESEEQSMERYRDTLLRTHDYDGVNGLMLQGKELMYVVSFLDKRNDAQKSILCSVD